MSTSSLRGTEAGTWRIRTASASYEVDFGTSRLVRLPDDPSGDVDPAALRRDCEQVPLLGVVLCRVGEPFVCLLDVRGDGVPTLRRSTPVQEITHLHAV